MKILAFFLSALLTLAVAGAVHVWLEIGDVEMSAGGIFAMAAGALATLGLGMGLMRLIFRSERRQSRPDVRGRAADARAGGREIRK